VSYVHVYDHSFRSCSMINMVILCIIVPFIRLRNFSVQQQAAAGKNEMRIVSSGTFSLKKRTPDMI